MKEKDLLEIYKERIEKESSYGDKAEACRIAGYSTQVYSTAMRKEKLSELTDGERRVLEELIILLNHRKQEINKFKSYGS